MVDAVTATVANTSLNRDAVVQNQRVAEALQAGRPNVPVAPFISPFIALDGASNTAVIQIRDSDTGDVLTQFPSESRIQALQREQALLAAQRNNTPDVSIPEQETVSQSAPTTGATFDAQSIDTIQQSAAPSTPSVAQAQLASAALAAAPSSGGAIATAAVNVTA